MKVAELIEKLKEIPQGHEVRLCIGVEESPLYYLCTDTQRLFLGDYSFFELEEDDEE